MGLPPRNKMTKNGTFLSFENIKNVDFYSRISIDLAFNENVENLDFFRIFFRKIRRSGLIDGNGMTAIGRRNTERRIRASRHSS